MSVIAALPAFFQRHVPLSAWRPLLQSRVEKMAQLLRAGYWLPCHDLCLTIGAGLQRNPTAMQPLAMATTLVYLGADLLDDLQDGDLDAAWQHIPPAQITMLAATLASALPNLAIAELAADAPTKVQLHATLARGLCAMSLGQQQDLAHQASDRVTLASVKAAVEGKSGAEGGLCALLGAQCAGARPEDAPHFHAFGAALVTAMQFASDLHELLCLPQSQDLRAHARSLPIAFALHTLAGPAHEEMLALLQAASADPKHVPAVLERLHATGSIDYTALVIEQYCQQSRALLARLPLTAAITTQLMQTIAQISLLRHAAATTFGAAHGTTPAPHPPQEALWTNSRR